MKGVCFRELVTRVHDVPFSTAHHCGRREGHDGDHQCRKRSCRLQWHEYVVKERPVVLRPRRRKGTT